LWQEINRQAENPMKWFLTVTSYFHGILVETEEFDSHESAKAYMVAMAEDDADKFVVNNYLTHEETTVLRSELQCEEESR
jgi:hypothetical protein